MTAKEQARMILQRRGVLLAIVLVGLALRLAAAALGHNYDMDSWYVVADITRHGGNVYAETPRYNYGPIWFQIVHLLDFMAAHHQDVLRYLIAGCLSAVDVGIFLLLCRRAGPLAGALFFLNPISILITGYHCQFDNLAILLAIWSALLFGDNFETPVNRPKLLGLLVLGLSLAAKHLFFLFPVWLAVKQKGFAQKVIIIAIPSICFLLSFAPYWPGGHAGIMSNVFLYHSSLSSFFYNFFVPQCIQFLGNSMAMWYGLMLVFAFICRRRNSFESLLIYAGALVAFSPSTTNQYLAIPVALAAVFPSVLFLCYTLIGTVQILADAKNGPHIWPGFHGRCDDLAIYILCCALLWLFCRDQIIGLLQIIRREIRLQLGDSDET